MTTYKHTDMDPRELARIAATSETPPALVVYAIPNSHGELSFAIGVDGLTLTEVWNLLNRAAGIAIYMDENESNRKD